MNSSFYIQNYTLEKNPSVQLVPRWTPFPLDAAQGSVTQDGIYSPPLKGGARGGLIHNVPIGAITLQ